MSETQQLELYLQNRLNPEDQLLLDARCLVDAGLRDNLFWQKRAYAVINQYGMKKMREEIQAVQNSLFTEKKFIHFRTKIKNIFK